MAQLIQIKRRIPGTGKPASGTGVGEVTAGELATSISVVGATGVANLYIGDGTYVHDLVSDQRQVELTGAQTITGAKTLGTGGSLTSPVANIHIQGGANGNFLMTDGAGANSWQPVPAAGIPGFSATDTYPAGSHVTYNGHIYRAHTAITTAGPWDPDDWDRILNESDIDGQLLSDLHIAAPLSGNGLTAGTALTVTPATAAQVTAGTDNVNPITSLRLREQLGADHGALQTTATTVIPAINELLGEIEGVSGAVRFIGSYDVPANEVGTAAGSPIADGDPLPPAAGHEGWYFIVSVGGTGTGNAPPVAMAVGDWIVSNGTAWIHVPLHHTAIVASAVGITQINSQPWSNVQTALAGIYGLMTTAGNAKVLADHVSVLGDGSSAANTASTGELRVGTVDGGTF